MSSVIKPFPSARRPGTVDRIASVMAKYAVIADAQGSLADFLDVYGAKLENLGVDDAEIEIELGLFAKAAWDRWLTLRRDQGVA
jgi:hypothetical protein